MADAPLLSALAVVRSGSQGISQGISIGRFFDTSRCTPRHLAPFSHTRIYTNKHIHEQDSLPPPQQMPFHPPSSLAASNHSKARSISKLEAHLPLLMAAVVMVQWDAVNSHRKVLSLQMDIAINTTKVIQPTITTTLMPMDYTSKGMAKPSLPVALPLPPPPFTSLVSAEEEEEVKGRAKGMAMAMAGGRQCPTHPPSQKSQQRCLRPRPPCECKGERMFGCCRP